MEFDDDVEVDESLEFEVDVMVGSKALAEELKDAPQDVNHKVKKEEIICENVEMTFCPEIEEAVKNEEVDEVIKHVEKKEEGSNETVEMDIRCEEIINHETREAQKPEVMAQFLRKGDIEKSVRLGAERPGQAQISFLEEENKPDENRYILGPLTIVY